MGTLVLVSTPIGNLGDLSPRALETLAHADIVCCEDTRHTRGLLTHAGLKGIRLLSLHDRNEMARVDAIVAHLTEGRTVAVVSDAGTPAVSDPGGRLVRAAVAAGATVTTVPGPERGAGGVGGQWACYRPLLLRGLPSPSGWGAATSHRSHRPRGTHRGDLRGTGSVGGFTRRPAGGVRSPTAPWSSPASSPNSTKRCGGGPSSTRLPPTRTARCGAKSWWCWPGTPSRAVLLPTLMCPTPCGGGSRRETPFGTRRPRWRGRWGSPAGGPTTWGWSCAGVGRSCRAARSGMRSCAPWLNSTRCGADPADCRA